MERMFVCEFFRLQTKQTDSYRTRLPCTGLVCMYAYVPGTDTVLICNFEKTASCKATKSSNLLSVIKKLVPYANAILSKRTLFDVTSHHCITRPLFSIRAVSQLAEKSEYNEH
jgi:hypothetical protein